MKKSDLISGKHIVETRIGDRFLVAGDYLAGIYGDSFMQLASYTEDLEQIDSFTGSCEHDICKVYEMVYLTSLPRLFEDSETIKLIWERKPELSEAERVILENIENKYRYIVRDEHGILHLYVSKPEKMLGRWTNHGVDYSIGFYVFDHRFQMVKWEDEEPTLISDLLEGKQ